MPRSLSLPTLLQRSDWSDALLLGLRFLLAADLARLAFYRWSTLNASLQMLEVEGFPAPEAWLAVALLAGGIGATSFVLGWRVRWGAALTLLVFLPVATVFNVTYVPTGWPPWLGTVALYFSLFEILFLGFALMGLFFFGAGRYTVSCGLHTANRWLCSLAPRMCFEHAMGPCEKQTAHQ